MHHGSRGTGFTTVSNDLPDGGLGLFFEGVSTVRSAPAARPGEALEREARENKLERPKEAVEAAMQMSKPRCSLGPRGSK